MKNLKTKRIFLFALLVMACFFWAQETVADMTTWSLMTDFTQGGDQGVWGSSDNDVFAVGEWGAIYHYDGSDWSEMVNPMSGRLYDIHGTSGNNVFAVGYSGFDDIVLYYDGGEWEEIYRNNLPNVVLQGVWCSSETDVFVVGGYRDSVILHYDGVEWTLDSFLPGQYCGFHSVWGNNSSDVFAVGRHQTIFHYDGSNWSQMGSNVMHNHLYDVWGSSANDVFAVGHNGTILHYNGTAWSAMASGTSNSLRSVWGSSATDVYAVGDYGTILYYDGDSWTPMNSGTSRTVQAVWVNSIGEAFALCWSGNVLHYGNQQYEVHGNWTVTSVAGGGTFDMGGNVTSGQVTVGVSVTGDITGAFSYISEFYPGVGPNGKWYGTSASIDGTVTVDGVDHDATLWLKGFFDTFVLNPPFPDPPVTWNATLSCPEGETHGWTTDGSKMAADFGWTGACSGNVIITGPDTWITNSGTGAGTWDGVSNTCLAGKTEYQGLGAGQVSLPMSPEKVTLDYDMSEAGNFLLTRYDSNPGSMPATRHILSRFAQVDSSVVSPEINWSGVTLEIEYTDEDITAAILNEDTLGLYWWDSEEEQWEKVAGSFAEPEANYVFGSLDHFSIYSIQGDPLVIYSCDDAGVPKDEFDEGESVYVTGSGLAPNTDYRLWVQSAGITDNDELTGANDLSETQELVTTDSNGNFEPVEIWEILGLDAGQFAFSIVADNQASGTVGFYNSADDELDSVRVSSLGVAENLIAWNDNLVADFGDANGLYYYGTANGWSQLAGWGDVGNMRVWNDGTNVNLVVDFGGGRGLYYAEPDGAAIDCSWNNLAGWDDVSGLATMGTDLVIDFGQNRGIYSYNLAGWDKICGWDNSSKMTTWGTDLVIDFGQGRGIFTYDGASFAKLCGWDNVDEMLVWDSDLVIDFGPGRGMYTNNGSTWKKICGWENPENIVPWGSNLVIDFGQSRGIYSYNGTGWDKICGWDTASHIVAWSTNLIIDFGQGRGIFTYNGATFSQISTWDDAEGITVVGSNLIIDYGTDRGIYSYDGFDLDKINSWSTRD